MNKFSKTYNICNTNRKELLEELLRLDHLNNKEREHVKNIIKKHSDRFRIPGEPLDATNMLKQNIPTTNEEKIFSMQYRFSPIYKEEITRQVNELLANNIIKPSQSSCNTPVWIVPKK